MKVAFYTLGCKVNAYETEAIMEMFMNKGYEIADYDDFSDVYIINSCMVTNSGERKSKQIIRRPVSINPNAIIIVMGCLSQLKAKAMLEIPGVKIVLGTKNRHMIIEYLNEYLKTGELLDKSEKLENDERFEELEINDFQNHKRAFLKIQDGCNNFCAYCIIPYTRGRIRSKTKDIILEEVKHLVSKGHIEIVLTGIHTGGYGEDLTGYSFASLLKDLEKIDGLKRIRISSIEITELDEEVLDVIRHSKKIVNHLHIPLQSGSERILKAMNRKYNKNNFKAKINEIRNIFDDISITTDVIVGFPGETEKEFQEAYDFIKEINFQELHVFPYSRRQGTPADKMKNQVNGTVKKARVHRLLELSDALKEQYMKSQIGKTKSVIIEQEKDGWYIGHSKDYLSIKVKSEKYIIAKEVEVILESIDFPNIVSRIKK
ncbi:MAG: tRNA (N(6)-L-threonylcarbamoyladenosine(37)-C(2))-methylthiotransferase MtaB [Tenericutes bacterium]|jgi:threonylcarbamoyladenosine tRNA methylthiotransferase MtaB|nr:tRNA (N(6)-L-threonylcarbamoyladenosine(37)-C(2))-methylthiotransferase MtaB [Mycoplasmatota bacterium]